MKRMKSRFEDCPVCGKKTTMGEAIKSFPKVDFANDVLVEFRRRGRLFTWKSISTIIKLVSGVDVSPVVLQHISSDPVQYLPRTDRWIPTTSDETYDAITKALLPILAEGKKTKAPNGGAFTRFSNQADGGYKCSSR